MFIDGLSREKGWGSQEILILHQGLSRQEGRVYRMVMGSEAGYERLCWWTKIVYRGYRATAL